MPARQIPAIDEWQLGLEPQPVAEFEQTADTEHKIDLSLARLARPVQIVTVEHLAWSALAIWAVVTRCLELSIAPLGPAEARHALFEYDLVNGTDWASAAGYHPVGAGWVHLLEAGVFAVAGPSDFAARLIFLLAGLILILMAFLMRRSLGRAGAIAVAGLITISPTFTYFSRSSSIALVAAASTMVVIEAFMALTRRPSLPKAVGLGCACGLLCASDVAGLATAVSLVLSLGLLGVYQVFVTDRVYLNLRVWLERYTTLLLVTIIAAGTSWYGSEISLFRLANIHRNIAMLWKCFSVQNYLAGSQYYAPGALLYEFLILLSVIAGLSAIVSSRIRSRIGCFFSIWLVISSGYFLGSRERDSERLVLMLLPFVMVGALGIEHLHHLKVWPYARVALFGFGALTIYVQLMANFIYAAPDANNTLWPSRANLYWCLGATPNETREHLDEIRQRFPEEGGTVYAYGTWQPSLRWYLRDFRPTRSAKLADLVINPGSLLTTLQDSESETRSTLVLEDSWAPTLTTLTPAHAVRFILSAAAWTPLRNSTFTITVRPAADLAPTLILPPPR